MRSKINAGSTTVQCNHIIIAGKMDI